MMTELVKKIKVDGEGLAAAKGSPSRAARKILERRSSYREITFQDGLPVPGKSQPGGDAEATLALVDILQTSEPNAAIQIARDAAAGQAGLTDLDHGLTTAIAQVLDLDPKTPLEVLLVAQMTAVNAAAGNCMRSAMRSGTTPECQATFINNATKLQRTFLAQIEALQRLRGQTGMQRVVVEHVTVAAGGQAVIGTVETGGRGEGDNGS